MRHHLRNFKYNKSSITNTPEEQDDKVISIYNLQGQKIPTNQQLPKGIYIYRNADSSTTIKYVSDAR